MPCEVDQTDSDRSLVTEVSPKIENLDAADYAG